MKKTLFQRQRSTNSLLSIRDIEALYDYVFNERQCLLSSKNNTSESHLLSKEKTQRDYLVLYKYLQEMKSLESLTSLQCNIDHFLKLITLISSFRKYTSGQFAYKCGEGKDDIYLLMTGSIDILRTQKIKVRMTEEEYMLYLTKLYYYQETDLFEKTILINQQLFGISIHEFNMTINNSLSKLKDIAIESNENMTFDDHASLKAFQGRNKKEFDEYYCYCLKSAFRGIINKQNKVTVINEYIERIFPNYIPFTTNQERINYETFAKKNCSIYQYAHLGILSAGQHFGESFTKTDHQFTTMIIRDDAIIGHINHLYFKSHIKEYVKESARECCKIILKNNLFSLVPIKNFLQLYSTDFTFHTETVGNTKLLSEYDHADKIFFIKSGEYEVYSTKSIKELTKMINYYCNDKTHIDSDDYMFTQMKPEYYRMKHPITLSLIAGSDVIGFYDHCMNRKYTFSVKMKSSIGEYFSIGIDAFTEMCVNNPSMYHNMNEYINSKRKLLYEKLVMFREKYYQEYLFLNELKQQRTLKETIHTSSRINIHLKQKHEIIPIAMKTINNASNIKFIPLKKIKLKRNIDLNHSVSPPKVLEVPKCPLKLPYCKIHNSKEKDDDKLLNQFLTERITCNNNTSNNKVPLVNSKVNIKNLNKTIGIKRSPTMNQKTSNIFTKLSPSPQKKINHQPIRIINKNKQCVNKFETLEEFWSSHMR